MNDPATATAPSPVAFELIGPLQAHVMRAIWQDGPSTVAQVMVVVNIQRQEKGLPALAYTTYLTVMRNLARRRLLLQAKTGGREHMFTPIVNRDTYELQLAKWVLETFFPREPKRFIDVMTAAANA